LHLDQDQQGFLRHIKQVVETHLAPLALEIESQSRFPQQAQAIFARAGLFTLAVPRSYGGQGAGATRLALMVENIARVSPSAALLVFPTNAVLRTIALAGSEEQKERLFGELVPAADTCLAFCLTEPDYGSEAFNLQTRAERQGEHYIVNGTKTFITLGDNARYYLTFVRTGPGEKAGGISALLIPRDAPGLDFGPPEKKMGLHGSVTSNMYLQNVPVPVANRLGGEGEGWQVLTRICNPMRVWGAAAMALGTAQGLFDQTLAYVRENAERLDPADRQSRDFALADMKMRIEACRSLIYRVCRMVDDPATEPQQVDAFVSMSKCYAADTGMAVGELAGGVLGMDLMRPDCLAGRLYLDAKAIQIFDGTNQIQRLVVAKSLALG